MPLEVRIKELDGIGGKGRPLQRDGTIRTKVGRFVYMEISSAMRSRTWYLVENNRNGKEGVGDERLRYVFGAVTTMRSDRAEHQTKHSI